MRKFWDDLVNGKWAIRYTLNVMANMVPREIRWLSDLPFLGNVVRISQLFWYLNKVIFFALFISWFKPQYHHPGAKIALGLITAGIILFAWWLIKKEIENRRSGLC